MSDEAKDQEHEQKEHTERGFGTGLRAQLQRRRDDRDEEAPSTSSTEPPLVRVDLYTSGSHQTQVKGNEPGGPELDTLKAKLADAEKRERELRAAFAEQVEAYERKLSEEFDVSRQAAKLDDKSSKLTATEFRTTTTVTSQG